jgi:hypothetical protein
MVSTSDEPDKHGTAVPAEVRPLQPRRESAEVLRTLGEAPKSALETTLQSFDAAPHTIPAAYLIERRAIELRRLRCELSSQNSAVNFSGTDWVKQFNERFGAYTRPAPSKVLKDSAWRRTITGLGRLFSSPENWP